MAGRTGDYRQEVYKGIDGSHITEVTGAKRRVFNFALKHGRSTTTLASRARADPHR
jgi:hypothetical protein